MTYVCVRYGVVFSARSDVDDWVVGWVIIEMVVGLYFIC